MDVGWLAIALTRFLRGDHRRDLRPQSNRLAYAANSSGLHPGNTASSVISKTQHLVAGEKADSKLDKARKLGVKVRTEVGFRQYLSQPGLLQQYSSVLTSLHQIEQQRG